MQTRRGVVAAVHIDPALVERLRDMTGATNQRCKEALRLHNGNADSAALWLLCESPSPAGASPASAATALAPGIASASPASPGSLGASVPAAKGGRETAKALDGGKPPTSPISASLSSPSSGGLPSPPANAAGSARTPTVPLTAESPGFDGAEMMGVVRDTPPGKPYGFISVWHHNVMVTTLRRGEIGHLDSSVDTGPSKCVHWQLTTHDSQAAPLRRSA